MDSTGSVESSSIGAVSDKAIANKPRSVNRLAVRFTSKNGISTANSVQTASEARDAVSKWLTENVEGVTLNLGLPEVDDRYQAWRVALLSTEGNVAGEVMVRCYDGEVIKATKPNIILQRLPIKKGTQRKQILPQRTEYVQTTMGNSSVVCGDARVVLRQLPEDHFHLVVTSPPYYNAKPEYSEYANYSEYMALLRDVFIQCHRTLKEGRFIIVNASPVLIRRPSRNKSSKRIPVPFHINEILEDIGFDFIDDIIWAKPTGAGWNTGRGRRFAADSHFNINQSL